MSLRVYFNVILSEDAEVYLLLAALLDILGNLVRVEDEFVRVSVNILSLLIFALCITVLHGEELILIL
jgi:hypothetical protein